MLPISIGILSWNSPQVLKATLDTYQKNGFFDLVKDCTVLFQEVTEEEKELARSYKLRFIGLDTNIGIGRGMQILAEQAREETFIFLEHDWQLIENHSTTKKRLIGALDLLEEDYKCIRLRSRKRPGHPLFSEIHKGNELNHFDSNVGLSGHNLFDCVHWIEAPELEFPDQIRKHKYHYVTTSRWANWTNNPSLMKTEFLLDTIKPFVSDLLLEPSISRWWADQAYHVAFGEGLFSHVDFVKYGS